MNSLNKCPGYNACLTIFDKTPIDLSIDRSIDREREREREILPTVCFPKTHYYTKR